MRKVLMLDEVDEERVFTLSEARSLIPRLRRLLARVTSERDVLISMRVEIDLAREKAEFGGGSPLGPTYLAHMIRFSEAVQAQDRLLAIDPSSAEALMINGQAKLQ